MKKLSVKEVEPPETITEKLAHKSEKELEENTRQLKELGKEMPSETNEKREIVTHPSPVANKSDYTPNSGAIDRDKTCPKTNEAPSTNQMSKKEKLVVETNEALKEFDEIAHRFHNEIGILSGRDQKIVGFFEKEFSSSIERARREGLEKLSISRTESYTNGFRDGMEAERNKQILGYEKGQREERQRVVEMLRKLKRTGQCTCMEDYSSCPYNIALSEVKEHLLDFPSDKETVPEGYILNPVEDGVAKYIKKTVEKRPHKGETI